MRANLVLRCGFACLLLGSPLLIAQKPSDVGFPTTRATSIYGFVLTPDGKTLAFSEYSWDEKHRVVVCDAQTGKVKLRMELDGQSSHAVALSPDSKTLAFTWLGPRDKWTDFTLEIWDVAKSEKRKAIELPRGGGLGNAYSPDGRSIVVSAPHGGYGVHDAVTGKQTAITKSKHGVTGRLVFSADGKWLLTWHGGKHLVVWDFAKGEEQCAVQNTKPVYHMSFSPKGERFVVTYWLGGVEVRETKTGKLLKQIQQPREKHALVNISFAQFLPDGKRIFMAGTGLEPGFLIWNPDDDTYHGNINDIDTEVKGKPRDYRKAVMTPDGKHLLTIARGIELWDAAALVKRLKQVKPE